MSLVFDCADPAVRPGAIEAAVRTVATGQLVVLPTDTVYGIGADAFDSDAVAALLAAKGRGRDVPVPVLVGSWETIDGPGHLCRRAQARELIEAFWPGGLTLVVEHAPSLSWDLGDARGTVAVRMPLHPVALELLAQTGPMAVSSANRHGQPAALTAGRPANSSATHVAGLPGRRAGRDRGRLDDRRRHRRGPAVLRAGAVSRRRTLRELLAGHRRIARLTVIPTHPSLEYRSSPSWPRAVATCSPRWPARSRSGGRRWPGRATATCTRSRPRGWAAWPCSSASRSPSSWRVRYRL